MLEILWLIVWATVGDAFYDDYKWYTSYDHREIRENFTDILRSFTDSYIPTREGDDEMTLAKAKSRLRMLKVFRHTGNSKDFEPSNAQVLPLHEGARFCTMGRHTKVNCNHCSCVAGQLYMCTGMICPKPPAKPQSLITCKEGKRRQVDSCNYCYCRHGHEICSTKDCSHNHDHLLLRSQYTCHEGARRKVDCNRCLCRNGEEYCTKKKCTKNKPTQRNLKQDKEKLLWAKCREGTTRQLDACNICYCRLGREFCESKVCHEEQHLSPMALRMSYRHDDDDDDDPPKKCKIGESYRIDVCNYCYCNSNRELVCSNNKCTYPQHVDAKYPLDITENGCLIGSRFRKGECNYCYCNYDRQLVCSKNICTRKSRAGLSDEKQVLRITRFVPAPKICLPHERFRLDACNWCYCDNGTHQRICEQNVCDPKQKVDTRWPPNSPKKGCYIGSRFSRGKCGYCYCSVYRRIECRIRYNCTDDTTTTSKPIINNVPKQRTRPRNSLNFECEVGEIQRIDNCNFCRCTFNGKWKCSDNVCRSNYDHHNFLLSKTKHCTKGIRHQVDACNYCVCHSGVEFCTQKPCWKDTVPTIFSELECLVGNPVPAPDPCNLCVCVDSNILCTDNPCIQRQSVSDIKKSRCVEGHKYKMNDGCNFCLCQGGQKFCTSRACLVNDNVVSDSDCNKGEVTPAEDGCNMCVCMKGKIICTNKNCSRRKLRDAISDSLLSYIRTQKIKEHKITQGTKWKCIPGKKYFPDDYDPNCPNECICDRHELLCTKRNCYNNWDKNTPFKWPPLGRAEIKPRNTKQLLLKQDSCVEYEILPSDDPCSTCICFNTRKVCTTMSCTDGNKAELGSDERMLIKILQSGKGHRGNFKKKNNTFCEPFTFFSPDNNRFCRNCFCLYNGLALCLLNLCKYSKDVPHQNSREDLDDVCTPGDIGYPTKCVSCTCSEQGRWICTREELALCKERDCDEKDEFHMGFSSYCAGCKCSVKEWFCSIESESCTDYSNATCPLGTFIQNPRQHCSICLCGGYEEGSHNMCFTEAKCVRQVISQLK